LTPSKHNAARAEYDRSAALRIYSWALKSPSTDQPARAVPKFMCNELGQCRVASLLVTSFDGAMPALARQKKITFGEMRAAGVRGLLIYCWDYKCIHSTAISGDRWPDHVRLSDIEPLFTCQACGKKGADVRPDFNWNKQPVAAMGYR
jgi:hypothetical protein